MNWRRETIVAVALAAAACVWGTWYAGEATRRGERFKLYDFSFGPAVMVACGKGYVDPRPGQVPALDDFLQTRVDRFDCRALPEQVATQPLMGFQRTFRYLMRTMAALWMVTGVSWEALSYLSGAMFALTIAATYGTIRLVAPVWLAVAAAVFTMTSPLHLAYLSDLRNYPKAPLAIALGFVVGLLLKAGSARELITVAAVFGVVLGGALGFRQDLLIYAPAFLLVLLIADTGTWPRPTRSKLMAAGIAIAACMVALGPQLSAYTPGGGASLHHVATLGLMAPFDEPLGVTNERLYEWGYYNEDSFAFATLAGHGERFLGMREPVEVYSRDYDAASGSYWGQLVRTFPADLLVRGYASALKLIELPSSTAFTQVPTVVRGRWFEPVWQFRGAALTAVAGVWAAASIAALTLTGGTNVRLGLGIAALLIYFLAYPALQFHERHYFYLDIVPIAAAAYLCTRLLLRPARVTQGPAPPRFSIRRAALFVFVLVVGATAPLAAARATQDATAGQLFRSYEAAVADPLVVSDRSLPDGVIAVDRILPAGDSGLPLPGHTRSELLVISLGGSACERFDVDLTLRYRTSHANPDFTRTFEARIGRPPEITRLFVPAFAFQSDPPPGQSAVSYRLGGIELPADQRPCLVGLAAVRDSASLPLLVTALLPPQWDRLPPYQTLVDWETRPRVVPALHAEPPDLTLANRLNAALVQLPVAAGAPATQLAEVVAIDSEGRWAVDGRGGLGGNGRGFYLAEFRGVRIEAGHVLLAEGVLTSGGLSLGLLRDGAWAAQVGVAQPGAFVAMVAAPATATYDVIVANNMPGRFQSNHFVLTRVGLTP